MKFELACSCACAFGASLSGFKLRAQVSPGAFGIVTAVPIFASALARDLWREGKPSLRAGTLAFALALALLHTSPPPRKEEDPNEEADRAVAEAQRMIAEADRLVEEASRGR